MKTLATGATGLIVAALVKKIHKHAKSCLSSIEIEKMSADTVITINEQIGIQQLIDQFNTLCLHRTYPRPWLFLNPRHRSG